MTKFVRKLLPAVMTLALTLSVLSVSAFAESEYLGKAEYEDFTSGEYAVNAAIDFVAVKQATTAFVLTKETLTKA